jgi:hypothetical protein
LISFHAWTNNGLRKNFMTRTTRTITGAASTLIFMMAGSDAIAGGIGFGPLAGIPALSGYMQMLLGVLLAALAYRKLRAYPGGKLLSPLVALGVIAAMSAGSGNQIIKSAEAIIVPDAIISIINPAGVSVHINPIGNTQVTNSTNVPLQITIVWADGGEVLGSPAPLAPQCIAGTVLQPGGSCYVNITNGN